MNRTLFAISILGLAACQGQATFAVQTSTPAPNPGLPTGGTFVPPSGAATAADACAGISVAASVSSLRRLTLEEQQRTYRDLLVDQALAPALAPPTGPVITEAEVETLNLAAQALVATQKHLTYLPCNPDGAFDSACADTFIASFGRFAFRRPLKDAETQWLRNDLYEALRTNAELSPPATFHEAIDAVAQAVLQSPELLYVHEEGVTDATLPAGVRRLTGYERATRLSFLLWHTTPDEALLTAAASGALDTVDGVRAEASRLLESPRAKVAVRSFVSSWLELDGNSHQASLEAAPKSATLFPFDGPSLRAAMREELLSLYEQTFFAQGGSFKALMTSPKAYVNKTLAEVYGLANAPANDSTFAWRDLDTTQRAGLFTRAGFLALYAPQDQKSPIRRGVFLYSNALCQPLGAPPANVDNTPLKLTDHPLTMREQVDARTGAASCQGCHARINPLGYTLEGYDAIGRFQTRESGVLNGTPYDLPINTTATPMGSDLVGPIAGPVALSQQLGESGMAHDCVSFTWFGRANARPLTPVDACSLQRLMRQFRQSDDMHELVLNLASDDTALFIQETK